MTGSIFLRKTLFSLFVYGIYYNAVFLLLRPSIYQHLIYLVYLGVMYVGGTIDTFLRPLDTDEQEQGGFLYLILLLFVVNPFLLVGADFEHHLFFSGYSPFLGILGLVIYVIATLTLLWSRLHLGKQGTGILVIVEDHHLITSGLYSYIRHPMYFGVLLGIVGFGLVVQSVIVTSVSFLLYFLVFNQRATYEETLLTDTFGEEYEVYQEGTSKLIPFIY